MANAQFTGSPLCMGIVLPIVAQSPNLDLTHNPGHSHPKELKNYDNGRGVAKQLARIARRDARKVAANG